MMRVLQFEPRMTSIDSLSSTYIAILLLLSRYWNGGTGAWGMKVSLRSHYSTTDFAR